MKHFLVMIALVVTTGLAAAKCNQTTRTCFEDYAFYTKVGTGVACSEFANVVAPYPPWNEATQGYNAKLGHCPIASVSLGCELWQVVDLEVNFTSRSIFKYRKFQTPTIGGDSYTREFDLNATSILFAANLLGRNIAHCNWQLGCGQLYPMIGVGLGASDLLITNFRTTGLPPTGDSSPYASFSSENQSTLCRNFTYTLLAGFEYNYNDVWAVGTGYRWFNAGSFKGPQYLRAAGGAAVDVASDVWEMRLRANEWFLEFKIFI